MHKSIYKPNHYKQLIPLSEFIIYYLFAVIVSFETIIIGFYLNAFLDNTITQGLGFLFYTNHLSSMIIIEYIMYLKQKTNKSLPKKSKFLPTIRTREWNPQSIYFSIALQLQFISLALGLVIGLNLNAFILATILLSWRFYLARKQTENKKTPHLAQRLPVSQKSLILNFISDVPFFAGALFIFIYTGLNIWLIAVSLILSYTFLVRAGQYEDERGPFMYAAILCALFISSLIIWPLTSGLQTRMFKIFIDNAPELAFIYYFIEALKKTPLRKRILSIVTFFTLIIIWIYSSNSEPNFSINILFNTHSFSSNILVTLFTTFSLTICIYAFFVKIGNTRKLVLKHRSVIQRFPFCVPRNHGR